MRSVSAMRIPICILFMLLAAVSTGCFRSSAIQARDGDIIFQRSQTRQSVAIQAATDSKYTHMGIIFIENGKPMVYEAVQPVKKTPLDAWIKQGKREHYVIKRLRDTESIDFQAVKRETTRMLGKNYDAQFGWSDSRIYCSELVWKAYQRGAKIEVGTLRRLGEFNLNHPTVKQLMKERYGKKIPLKMTVISPADMFQSDKLVVIQKG